MSELERFLLAVKNFKHRDAEGDSNDCVVRWEIDEWPGVEVYGLGGVPDEDVLPEFHIVKVDGERRTRIVLDGLDMRCLAKMLDDAGFLKKPKESA